MMRTHRVAMGETLATIAQTYYKDPSRWAVIYQHNERYIADPNHLDAGQTLIIPHLVAPGLADHLFI